MVVFTVENISEADYGCEDTGRNGPAALLKLRDCLNGEEKNVEIPESVLAAQGISEGKKVCFNPSGDILKYVRVVAAVIRKNENGTERIYATARGYGEYKGMWEFPGGKIEAGETPQQALIREIREELTAEITVGELIKTVEYDYPEFHLSMDCFWAEVSSGQLILKEAEEARWLSEEELNDVEWLPADLDLVGYIKTLREK